MDYLVTYKYKKDIEELKKIGKVTFVSKLLPIVCLRTDLSIEKIKDIEGIIDVELEKYI